MPGFCITCNETRAAFNYPDEKTPLHCSNCRFDTMVNIRNKRCIKCNKAQEQFNYPETTILYCFKYKLMEDIKISKKVLRVTIHNQIKNYQTETQPLYCSKCKLAKEKMY